MKKSIIAIFAILNVSSVSRADIYDRINACEQAGGGACIFNLLRELASQPGQTPFLNSGVYISEGWFMNVIVSVSGNTVSIYDDITVSQAGTYQCSGTRCVGPQYSFDVVSADEIYMSYGRTWKRRP